MPKLLTFGITKDIINEPLDSNWTGKSVGDLRVFLLKKYSSLNDIPSFAIALNEEYALDDEIISSDDIIAIIPPVSGG